jgi:hypothetical protein
VAPFTSKLRLLDKGKVVAPDVDTNTDKRRNRDALPRFARNTSRPFANYREALGRQLNYAEFSVDHQQVVGGEHLNSSKAAFADQFVQRAEFTEKYQDKTTAESFVDAMLSQ